MAAPDPQVVERQMYVDMHLGGVDNPSYTLADLRDLGGGGVNAFRAAVAGDLGGIGTFYSKEESNALLGGKLDKALAPLHLKSYTTHDGIANDTAAVVQCFADAIAQNKPVYSEPDAEYLVDEITINGALELEGHFNFSARTADQPYMFNITETVDWSRASVIVNGKNRTLYGIRGADFGRSSFGYLDVQRCKIWGFQFDPTGNNNVVSVDKFVARLNGSKITNILTETAETANVLTSSAGYGTFTLGTPLTAAQVAANATYWVISAGLAYKIRSITTTTIEVFNLKAAAGVGDTITVDVIVGGGLNLTSYGDNGVGRWGSMDMSANSNAIHISSLYGHTFINPVFQANTIGISCSDYTIGVALIRPYFETSVVNYVSWSYMSGTMFAPTMELETMQNCVNRLASNPYYDPQMVVIKDRIPGLTSPRVPAVNPGSVTLLPGQSYAYHKSGASTWNFVIDNHERYMAQGAYFISVDLSHGSSLLNCPISLTLANNNGDTIEGSAFGVPYTALSTTGKAILKIYKVGIDWKVTISFNRTPSTSIASAPVYVGQQAVVGSVSYIATGIAAATDWRPAGSAALTTIGSTPTFIGQRAVVAGIAYISVGTASSADWKQITFPVPIASIAATPTYVGQLAVVGAIGYMAVGTASSADWKQVTN